jgi:teichuronic acid biosynthesis glycosyltransferase TuaC
VKILSTTLCYPTPARPTQGIFIHHRLAALARLADVRVVCPVPFFPGYSAPVPADRPDPPVPVYYQKMPYFPGILKTLDATFFASSLRRRVRFLREEFPFDLIDAHFVWPDGVGAAAVAWKLGVPIVVTVRGKLGSQIRYALRRGRIIEMLRSVDGRIAVSGSLGNLVRQTAGAGLDVRVIPNGVDTEVFRPMDRSAARDALGLSREARWIVSVGQIREIKGFDRLVAVLPEVRRRVGDVRLVLIGPSIGERGYEDRVRGLIQGHRLGDVVRLTGAQEQATVARYLAAADLFALATRSEGWCNAIHEAMAAGTPVVATDVGGNRELITSDGLGLLVPFGQPAALADAIVRALETEWDREAIGTVGRERTWSRVASETLMYFEEVLSRRQGHGGGFS